MRTEQVVTATFEPSVHDGPLAVPAWLPELLEWLGAKDARVRVDAEAQRMIITFTTADDPRLIADAFSKRVERLGWRPANILWNGHAPNRVPLLLPWRPLIGLALVAILAWMTLFAGWGPEDLDDHATNPVILIPLLILPLTMLVYATVRQLQRGSRRATT